MVRWLLGLMLPAVIGMVAMVWLITSPKPPPEPRPPSPDVPRGYVIVKTGSAAALADIADGATVCGTAGIVERLENDPAMARFALRRLPATEVNAEWQEGHCAGVLVRVLEQIPVILPHGLEGAAAIEFTD